MKKDEELKNTYKLRYNNYLPYDKIEDLIKLSSTSEINLFKKNKNKWILRDTRIIVNECNKLKKKKVKNLSTDLKKISNNPKSIELAELKNINDKTIGDINTIDNIIKIVNETCDDIFIEIYSN